MPLLIAIKNLLARFPVLDGQFRRFIWSRIHFPEGEMRFLAALPVGSIDVAVDVGAALGSYAWILSRKSTEVFAFEPGTEHWRYLSRLVTGSNITLVRSAVGADTGSVSIYTPGADENARHSATLSVNNPVIWLPGTTCESVPLVSLDGFFTGRIAPGRTIDLIKIDIEGYEMEALKGARGLIEKYWPLLICEIEKRHNAKCGLIFDLLRSIGYRCYICQGGNFHLFEGRDIAPIQGEQSLRYRTSPHFDPAKNTYINNFVFQHPESKIKVAPQ